jgi:predicted  nucleic acid-binding Zn-ribbon protein
MQPASKSGKKARVQSKPTKSKAKKVESTATRHSPKGNGLTIPEQVERARKRAHSVQMDIAKTQKRLAELQRQLADAERQLKAALSAPRRSALGQALAKAAAISEAP